MLDRIKRKKKPSGVYAHLRASELREGNIFPQGANLWSVEAVEKSATGQINIRCTQLYASEFSEITMITSPRVLFTIEASSIQPKQRG